MGTFPNGNFTEWEISIHPVFKFKVCSLAFRLCAVNSLLQNCIFVYALHKRENMHSTLRNEQVYGSDVHTSKPYCVKANVVFCGSVWFCLFPFSFYYPTTPVVGKYGESIREVNIFFILHFRISSINTRGSCFSKYYISVVFSKLKIFIAP